MQSSNLDFRFPSLRTEPSIHPSIHPTFHSFIHSFPTDSFSTRAPGCRHFPPYPIPTLASHALRPGPTPPWHVPSPKSDLLAPSKSREGGQLWLLTGAARRARGSADGDPHVINSPGPDFQPVHDPPRPPSGFAGSEQLNPDPGPATPPASSPPRRLVPEATPTALPRPRPFIQAPPRTLSPSPGQAPPPLRAPSRLKPRP